MMHNKKLYNTPGTVCFGKMYTILEPRLLTYDIKYKGKKVKYKTLPQNYVIPYEIARDTDIMLGYGVLDNMDAEELYSSLFKKPSYGFDCGVKDFKPKEPLAHFESSCIATDEFLLDEGIYKQESSGSIHTLGQKIKELKLKDKRIIVKMDIAGAEYDALPDIIKNADNVDIITVRFHFSKNILAAVKVLDMLSKDYILVARSEHIVDSDNSLMGKLKIEKEKINPRTTLTFVNKRLISSAYLPFKQDSHEKDNYNDIYIYKPTTIPKVVVLNKKLKNIKERILNK